MKLYISCEIDFSVDFQYQVYPKCVSSQCNDVNDKKLEYKNGESCAALDAGNYVEFTTDKSKCLQWYYSCDEETIFTKIDEDNYYINTPSGWGLVEDAVTTKFDIIPNGNQFLIAIKGGDTCLNYASRAFKTDGDCTATDTQLFSWV